MAYHRVLPLFLFAVLLGLPGASVRAEHPMAETLKSYQRRGESFRKELVILDQQIQNETTRLKAQYGGLFDEVAGNARLQSYKGRYSSAIAVAYRKIVDLEAHLLSGTGTVDSEEWSAFERVYHSKNRELKNLFSEAKSSWQAFRIALIHQASNVVCDLGRMKLGPGEPNFKAVVEPLRRWKYDVAISREEACKLAGRPLGLMVRECAGEQVRLTPVVRADLVSAVEEVIEELEQQPEEIDHIDDYAIDVDVGAADEHISAPPPSEKKAVKPAETSKKNLNVAKVKEDLHKRVRASLERFKKDRTDTLRYSEAFLDLDAVSKPGLSKEEYEKTKADYGRLVENARGFLKALGAEANTNNKKIERLMLWLHDIDYLKQYCRDDARMSDLLIRRCGNCSANTQLILSILQDLQLKPDNGELAIENFMGHVQVVAYDRKSNRILDLLTNRSREKSEGDLYHPLILARGFEPESEDLPPEEAFLIKRSDLSPEEISKRVSVLQPGWDFTTTQTFRVPKGSVPFTSAPPPARAVIGRPQLSLSPAVSGREQPASSRGGGVSDDIVTLYTPGSPGFNDTSDGEILNFRDYIFRQIRNANGEVRNEHVFARKEDMEAYLRLPENGNDRPLFVDRLVKNAVRRQAWDPKNEQAMETALQMISSSEFNDAFSSAWNQINRLIDAEADTVDDPELRKRISDVVKKSIQTVLDDERARDLVRRLPEYVRGRDTREHQAALTISNFLNNRDIYEIIIKDPKLLADAANTFRKVHERFYSDRKLTAKYLLENVTFFTFNRGNALTGPWFVTPGETKALQDYFSEVFGDPALVGPKIKISKKGSGSHVGGSRQAPQIAQATPRHQLPLDRYLNYWLFVAGGGYHRNINGETIGTPPPRFYKSWTPALSLAAIQTENGLWPDWLTQNIFRKVVEARTETALDGEPLPGPDGKPIPMDIALLIKKLIQKVKPESGELNSYFQKTSYKTASDYLVALESSLAKRRANSTLKNRE